MKLVQIVPRQRVRLYGAIVKKEADIRKNDRGTFYRTGRKKQNEAKWNHKRFKGSVALKRGNDETVFMRLDREFNLLGLQAARNEFASRAMGLMHGLSRRFWYQHYRESGDLPLSARLHAEVAEAIAKRDGEAAAKASDRLLDYIESFTRKTIEV